MFSKLVLEEGEFVFKPVKNDQGVAKSGPKKHPDDISQEAAQNRGYGTQAGVIKGPFTFFQTHGNKQNIRRDWKDRTFHKRNPEQPFISLAMASKGQGFLIKTF